MPLALLAALALAAAPAGAAAKDAHRRLVWSDEFDGPDGAPPDPAKWSLEQGTGEDGWGNQELEAYTTLPENVRLEGGNLVITARREPAAPEGTRGAYSSARLTTKGKFARAYGRFEARIKVPRGQGLWPAFWLLGADIDKAGWPACGEVDVMENIGREPSLVHGTLHGPGYSGKGGPSSAASLPAKEPFAEDFHVYATEWEPKRVRFYVDGRLYATRTPKDLPRGKRWVYDHPMFVILNLAVGGGWPGSPDATTSLPQSMLVDWVRVYE